MPDKKTSDGTVGFAVLYAAKSSPDERESIPDQLRDGHGLADRENLKVVGEYFEENQSAYKGDRGPELANALAHAGEVGAQLIVQHSDRLARGDGSLARHLAELYFTANRAGITLRSVQDDSTFDSPILVAVMGERNMEDSRRKSAAVKAGHARRRKRGKYPGGPAPYGYLRRRNEDDELMLVPDPALVPVVQRIYTEYIAGVPQLTIARNMDADGIPTHRGGKWHQGTVANILSKPVYIGMLEDEGELVEATHDPIIDRETWDQAARLREQKATHTQGGRGRPSAGNHLFVKGHLRCKCGGSFMPRTDRRDDGSLYESYVCYEHRRDPTACSQGAVARHIVDESVFNYFSQVGLDIEATREQLSAALDRRVTEVRGILSAAEQAAQEAEARLTRVKRDYTNGDLTAAEWRELKAELEPQRAAAEAEAERLRDQADEAAAGAALADAEGEVLAQLARIRAALAGEVAEAGEGAAKAKITDPETVASVRAVLLRLFDSFTLHVATEEPERVNADLLGVEYWLEPAVSAQAIEGYDEKMLPILSRQPLEQAKNNSHNVFQP